MKNKLLKILIPGMLLAPLTVFGGNFDGSNSLLCVSIEINECLPGEGCSLVTATSVDAPQFIKVDFENNTLTGDRTAGQEKKSAIERMETVDGKLMLQGAEDGIEAIRDGIGWTLSITQSNGKMVLTGSGENVGFVIFGACTTL